MPKKEKFTMRVAVYLFLMKGDSVLLLRRYNTGWKDGEYSVVAGHVEEREAIVDAMIREAKEEAGITLRAEDARLAHTQHRVCPDVEYIDFSFVATAWEGEPTNLEPEKCDDLSWYPLESLPPNTIPYITHVIESIQQNVPFSEWREPGV